MTIQGALYSSLSSLQVLAQQTSVISNNIANASTPGYVQQNLPQSELIAGGLGDGVVAGAIQRLSDAAAAAGVNQANGTQAYSSQMVSALTPYVQAVGQASDSTSLPSSISAFASALTTLSSTPNDATAQGGAVTAAQNLVATFHNLDAAVSGAREQADQGIASGVADVNNTLDQLAQNQTSLKLAAANGNSTASYQDTQDQLLAGLSKDLPVKVFHNDNNGIIVTTDQGNTLFDGQAHHLSFTATADIPSNLRVTADPAEGYGGGLSSVMVDGKPVAMSQTGSIAANLQLRDVTLTGFADQLDQMAGNLIGAFQSQDPSVSAGKTGIFTAGGAALNTGTAAAIPGLAGTIALNASVDPTQGGQASRMRDGAQATSPGAASDNSTILGFIQVLQTPQSYGAATGLNGSMTLGDAASQASGAAQSTLANWTSLNTSRTQQAQDAQTALTSKTGVSVDDQLQRLMQVQQTYAASAQVIQAASSMLNDLLTTLF